jgi:hypothetical protein
VVDVASVEALDDELAREAEVLTNRESLLVDILSGEVFGDAAVVGVTQLDLVILVVEQVVHVNIVDIALDVLQVQVALPTSLPAHHCVFVLLPLSFFVRLLFLILRLVLIGFLEPGVRQNLREGKSVLGVQLNHAPH